MGLSVNFVYTRTYIPIAMTENQQAIVVPKTFYHMSCGNT